MQREFAYRASATLTALMEDADHAKLLPIFHNVAFVDGIIQAVFINGTKIALKCKSRICCVMRYAIAKVLILQVLAITEETGFARAV